MAYKSYLALLSQLSSQNKAKIPYQGYQVLIEKGEKKNHWIVSTKVFIPEEEVPHVVKECVSSSRSFQWQVGGAFLQFDKEDSSVVLVQPYQGSLTFIPFKDLMGEFVSLADEWNEIFYAS